MSILDSNFGNLVPIFWAISIYILIRLAMRRIIPTATIDEWEYQTQVAQIRQKASLVTIQKIYQTLRLSGPKEIAAHIRDELTGNAAIAYDLPPTFFIKHRSEPQVLRQYFKDEELLMFFNDPKRWSMYNGVVKRRLFGLIGNVEDNSTEFYNSLERIMHKFDLAISGITNKSPDGQR